MYGEHGGIDLLGSGWAIGPLDARGHPDGTLLCRCAGGFAMVHGDPGSGKSIVLRVLAERLKRLPDVTVGAINHPQSNLADFYRELGDVFGVPLRPSNRWGGFKALRTRWLSHMESSRCRAVLLVDEAQEMTPQVLSELRLLASSSFDSQSLLCIVMAGDARLIEKLRREELIPLGSRIRTRLATEFASRDELLACLEHLLAGAGNASLMTQQLRHNRDGPGPSQTPAQHGQANDRFLHACPWALRPATRSRCGSSQPLAQPNATNASQLAWPGHRHRG